MPYVVMTVINGYKGGYDQKKILEPLKLPDIKKFV